MKTKKGSSWVVLETLEMFGVRGFEILCFKIQEVESNCEENETIIGEDNLLMYSAIYCILCKV